MTEASFLELVSHCKKTGLSVRDFCSNEGIPQSTYYYWRNKLNKKAAQPKRFIPLVVSSNLAAQKKDQFSHSDPHISAAGFLEDNKFEFVFPNGTRLLIRDQIDLAFLQSIAHLYD